MVTKELIDARWKILTGILLSVVLAALVAFSYDLVKSLLSGVIGQLPSALQSQVRPVMSNYDAYTWYQWYGKNGQLVLGALAAFIGGGLIAGEVSKGTIFFLLSKPLSRGQVILTKYATGAAIQLAVCVVGSLVILIAGAVLGHPQSIEGVAMSTLLLWLGTMFVLGLALFFSVIFDDLLRPVGAALVIAVLVGIPGLVAAILPGWANWSLPTYWANLPAHLGQSFPGKELAICLVAAALPVVAAVALFKRRAF